VGESRGLRPRMDRCGGACEGQKGDEKKMILHGMRILMKMNFPLCAAAQKKVTIGRAVLTKP
ncbi:MAG: hypothetical protein KDC70_18720, partial [Saprospiraceae bacterium]|nr:hypothetical protein [Saprospiraceae bacterium]